LGCTAIKNWERVKHNIWYNSQIGWWVRIASIGGKVGKKEWVVEIEKNACRYEGIKGNYFLTEASARAGAIRWMRQHPEG